MLAQVFGVSLPFFDRDIKPLVADKYRRRSGRKVLYLGRAVLDAWVESQVKKRVGAAGDGADPLLVGKDSPSLERYREERFKLAKLDRMAKEKELLPRADVRTGYGMIAGLLRQLGETFQQQTRITGAEAHEMLEETLSEAGRVADRMFGSEEAGS